MVYYANGHLLHRGLLKARQAASDTKTTERSTAKSSTSTSTSTSTSSTSSVSSTSSLRKTSSTSSVSSSSLSSTSSLSSSSSSSSSTSALPTATSSIIRSTVSNTDLHLTTTTSSSRSSTLPPATSSAAAAVASTNTGAIAGGILGTLAALFIIICVVLLIIRRSRERRERRERLEDVNFFDQEKLHGPDMFHGITAGPGANYNVGARMESDLPPVPESDSSDTQHVGMPQRITYTPASPHPSAGNPFSPVPSTASFVRDDAQLGAPPIPGLNGPAPYGHYSNPFTYQNSNQFTPPVSPYAGGQNPFSTPPASVDEAHFTRAPAWSPAPVAFNSPLQFGAPFSVNEYRDSGYSVAGSEAHVGQAYKVQVGMIMPKYEELTRATRKSPLPSFPSGPATTPDPVDSLPNPHDIPQPAEGTVNNLKSEKAQEAFSARPTSTATVYNPEEAYGGV